MKIILDKIAYHCKLNTQHKEGDETIYLPLSQVQTCIDKKNNTQGILMDLSLVFTEVANEYNNIYALVTKKKKPLT